MNLYNWGLAGALRAANLTVVETPGWGARSHGQLPDSPTVVWHHDASPKGDSPGALDWMLSNWNTASAQLWIDRRGWVYLVGGGVAWHAGAVLADQHAYDNFHAVGIETDHTTGEEWPPAQLNALRTVTAVILDRGGRSRSDFSFHRLICSPVGRKSDPAGLDLVTERAAVVAIGRAKPTKPTTPAGTAGDGHDTPTNEATETDDDMVRLVRLDTAGNQAMWLVDFGAHTKRELGQVEGEYDHLVTAVGIRPIVGEPRFYASYTDVTVRQ